MTLKLSPEERKKYTLERKKRNMKDYYNRRKEEHREKCRIQANERYEKDEAFRILCNNKVKQRYLFKKEFKILCNIDFF